MQHNRFSFGRILLWLFMLLILFITLFPFYWVVRTALTPNAALFQDATSLVPDEVTMANFVRALGIASTEERLASGGSVASLNFFLFLRNSIIFSTLATAGQVFFSTMAAYAFARLRWVGRDTLFTIYISALMVPGIVLLIPNFVLIRNLGLQGTFAGMVAPYFFMTPFAVFFLRQFFLGINRELEEAAKIDGANHLVIFGRIILPLSGPPITTLAIIQFITAWNDYLWPFIVGRDESVRVLTVALNVFRQAAPGRAPDWTGLMAATALSILPVLILYMLLGKRVINSIQFSGFK